ncbi:hypothetical protein E8P82_12700 [Arthrobacter echini]|uniref:Uncharacterized protein n=1 Tax=Arthrobacter echini TaxID=1529066 RepID=A0A4S5E1F3_9MICC|nr:hypothetical protein [Arthrobacter echini]THJ65166.1 hypothetical protein E8P82_12700 [Arthrobacter echini]
MDVIGLLGILSSCLVIAAGAAVTGWRLDVVSQRGGETDDYFWVAFGGVVVVAGAGVVAVALGGLWPAALTAAVSIPAVSAWLWRRVRTRRAENEIAARSAVWSELLRRHDAVARRWADYDLDPAKAIDHPEMHDPSHPAARRVVHALRAADTERDAAGRSTPGGSGDVRAYADAVRGVEHAFDLAEQEVGVPRTGLPGQRRELPG